MSGLTGEIATKGTVTGSLQAVYGKDGITPHIGENLNWWIGDEDTGVYAKGVRGENGDPFTYEDFTPEQLESLKGDTGNPGVYLGSGDMPSDCNVQIDPEGEVITLLDAVTVAPQTFTDGQKAQARENIGAADSAFVGDSAAALDAVIEMQEALLNASGTKPDDYGTPYAVEYIKQELTESAKAQARENIGAAPAGYGLGTQTQTRIYSLAQLDNTLTSGWYDLWLGSVEGENVFGSTHGSLFVNAGRMAVEQVFIPYRRDRKAVRTWFDDTGWGEWEWVKPHMIDNFEFCTTERWNGKVVYTKLVNCGAFPAEGSRVHIGLLSSGITKILRVSGTAEQMGYSVPYIDPNAAIHISGTVYGDGYVVLYVEKGDFTADNCIAQVWYVKE